MTIPRMPQKLEELFVGLAETAMSVHYVYGRYAQYDAVAGFIIINARYFLPVHPYESLPSLGDLHDGVDVDAEADAEPSSAFEVHETFRGNEEHARYLMFADLRRLAFGPFSASTPVPPPGTPLVLHTSTTGTDAFLRFTYSSHDPLTQGRIVQAGTYATPYRDGTTVNSGFAAVARYALPVPLAAKYVRLLTPPAGTPMQVGASGPQSGQSGGGVEAYFPNAFANRRRPFTIPEY